MMDNLGGFGRTVTAVTLTLAGVAALSGAAPGGTLPAQIDEHLRRQDNQAAAELLERHLQERPSDAVMLYNAACVRCRLGELDRGAAYFIRAVKAGFADISHARRDPDLRALRGHPVFRAVIDASDAADETLARRRMEGWRRQLGDASYRYEMDTSGRIVLVSSLDAAAHEATKRLIRTHTDHLQQTLFAGTHRSTGPGGYIVIVIPSRADAARLLTRPYVTGLYNHRRRELVTFGHSRALRHELAHALHHRHMDVLGQEHPLWIQEGLASLYEEYLLDDDGTIHFPANDRHEQAKLLARDDRLMSWPRLAAVEPTSMREEAFVAYPQLRSIFRFIAEQGRLESWYRLFVEGFEVDPTGLTALETVFDRPLAEVEMAWRRWLDGQG